MTSQNSHSHWCDESFRCHNENILQLCKNVTISGYQYLWQLQAVLVHCCPRQCCFTLPTTNFSDYGITNIAKTQINIFAGRSSTATPICIIINSYGEKNVLFLIVLLCPVTFRNATPTLSKDWFWMTVNEETYVRWCRLVERYGLRPNKVWTWRQCSCLQCTHVIF